MNLIRGLAGQFVYFHLVSKTDGSDVTTGTPTVQVTSDSGTQSPGAGSISHLGGGQWRYTPTTGELALARPAYLFQHASAVSVMPSVNVIDLALFGVEDFGTAQAATASTLQLRTGSPFAAAANGSLAGRLLVIESATLGSFQTAWVTGNTGNTINLDPALPVAPTGTVTYRLFAGASSPTGAGVPLSQLKPGTHTGAVIPTVSAVTTVNGIAANAITAASTSADFVTELATAIGGVGLTGPQAAELTLAATNSTAIKGKTDQMVFTKANELDVNTQSVNGTTLIGDGVGTPIHG